MKRDIVVPNGRSIINFNNGKINAAEYSQYVYGMILWQTDGPRRNILKKPDWLCSEYAGSTRQFLQRLIRRDAAAIQPYKQGKYSSYNHAYTSFMLRIYDVSSIFGSTGSSADFPL